MTTTIDVLIIGAGISGLGSACHLKEQLPDKSFLIVEAHTTYGGTWHIHRYPGIRSDSDLFTFGYRFKPWTGAPIATGEEIMSYLGELIDERGLADSIRYGRRVTSIEWDSVDAVWVASIEVVGAGETEVIRAGFIWNCAGYYRHDRGHLPDWPGLTEFGGRVIHPQHWPEDADFAEKDVVVIGSGATAATLVPALVGKCKSLTMLQRTPTYFYSGSNSNPLADELRELEVEPQWIHEIVRKKILRDQRQQTELALAYPKEAREALVGAVREQLGDDVDVARHFNPPYDPWRQRIAFVPDGDLFKGVRSGAVTLLTDTIEHFERDRIVLGSGQVVHADVGIAATGFELAPLGDVPVLVDGRHLDGSQELTWRGVMVTNLPNLVWVFGYFRASWTLRVDLLGDFVCRLFRFMDGNGYRSVQPLPDFDLKPSALADWSEGQEFAPGYMKRGAHKLPKSGPGEEWSHTQDYWTEREHLPVIDLHRAPLLFK